MALPEFVIHAFHPADLAEYQRLDELTYDRKDKPQIQAMAQWLVEHLGEGEVAYMIPDDMLYNPSYTYSTRDTFLQDPLLFLLLHKIPMAF